MVEFGAAARTAEAMSGDPAPAPAAPCDLAFEAMEGLSGRVAFASPPDEVAAMFPAASAWLGPRRVAALAASTLLVGMVCPGLHSIYGGLTVEACDEPVPEDRLGFRVVATEPRFRSVRMTIAGGGLVGAVESYARTPPAPQASSRDLAGLVDAGEFAGSTALVIGGSRGLGEVTAKLLAAGGAKAVIGYRVGAAEAEAVADEIRAAGGRCETLAYDAVRPAEPQLAGLDEAPTHAYYFATPTIFRAQSALFARARLDAFLDVYVDGFLRPGAGAAGATQRRVAVLSVIGVCRGAAARHARIRHGQGGRRDALQRDEPGVGAAARHRVAAAALADRSDRVGHRDHAPVSRSRCLAADRARGAVLAAASKRSASEALATGPSPLQTASAGQAPMLFNSQEFLFVFLPATLVGFYLLGRASRQAAILWLILVSWSFTAGGGRSTSSSSGRRSSSTTLWRHTCCG